MGNPIDLSTYTLQSQIRKAYTSLNAYSFSVTGGADGVITLALSANASSAIPAGRYVYDLRVIDDVGNASRILEGQVKINPSVSR